MRIKPQRFLQVFGLIFGVLGLGLLVAAAVVAFFVVRFDHSAETTTGKVVNVSVERSCSGRSNHRSCGIVYRPTVQFQTADGQQITFTSKVASSTQRAVGEQIGVRYPADDPQNARVAGGGEYLAAIIMAAIGVPFLAVGLILGTIWLRSVRKESWLRAQGNRVQGQILGVQRNRQLRINNVHPWQIYVGWRDHTGRSYTFTSRNLMDDPTPLLAGRTTLDVLIDPAQPDRRHLVDLDAVGITD